MSSTGFSTIIYPTANVKICKGVCGSNHIYTWHFADHKNVGLKYDASAGVVILSLPDFQMTLSA